MNARSAIKIFPGVAGFDAVLSDLTGNMEQFAVTGKASLSGLLAPQPTFAVTFSSSPVQISELLDKIPAVDSSPIAIGHARSSDQRAG